jgi:Tol biopolymer transport system component/class 3 adenylate cyclase
MKGASEASADVRAFLIADVRGYTLFTAERGDEEAAKLAARFAQVAREGVEARSGTVVELRGDEALCVFSSPRQAIRAAMDLQQRFAEETQADSSLPLPVGIGLDAGEAVPLEGGYRGGALNLAARLCGQAGPGEILASSDIVHLAGHIEGIAYADRGHVALKGLAEPVRVISITAGVDSPAPPRRRASHVPSRFGAGRRRRGRAVLVGVVLVAAAALGIWWSLSAQEEPLVSPSFGGTSAAVPRLAMLDWDTKQAADLPPTPWSGIQPSWNVDGSRIAFVSDHDGDEEIFAVSLAGTGTPTQLTDNTVPDRGPDWSPKGELVFSSDRKDRDTAIYIWAGGGDGVRLFDRLGHDGGAVWSRDGTMIAFSSEVEGTADIWVMRDPEDPYGSETVRLTETADDDTMPAWSPDGTMIAFTRKDSRGVLHVWVMSASGSDPRQLSTPSVGGANPTWSPDGKTIVYAGIRPGSNHDLYAVAVDEAGDPRRLTATDGDERDPDWEPVKGGTRIVYAYVADPDPLTAAPS